VNLTRRRLLEMRITSEMRVGKAADDAPPPGVESAEVALRDLGFRLTAPRHAEIVGGIKAHPTAEEVHRLVTRRAPGVSLGTVYRNLRLLVDTGLLVNCTGHGPASTPTREPIITSRVCAAGAWWMSRHP
jgi:ferric uptake regulator family protein